MPGENKDALSRGSEDASSEPPRYLAVARVVCPWGVRGLVKAIALTDFPERFQPRATYLIGAEHRPIRLEQSRPYRGGLLFKFVGYDTPEACNELRDQILYVPMEEALPLPEGFYYIHQIIGLDVWTEAGDHLGRVSDVWETGANDVYVVDQGGKLILLPAIAQVVLHVDLGRSRMTVHLMEGLVP
jgi:16S rRNA processing protein RimM